MLPPKDGRALRVTMLLFQLSLLPKEYWAVRTAIDHSTPEMLSKGRNALNVRWAYCANLGGPRRVEFDAIEGECTGPSMDRLREVDEDVAEVRPCASALGHVEEVVLTLQSSVVHNA
jgi:hypothetical protein